MPKTRGHFSRGKRYLIFLHKMAFSMDNNVLYVFFFLSLFRDVCLVMWTNFHDGCYTSAGMIGEIKGISLSHCTAECFVSTTCEVLGYGTSYNSCYLFDKTFSPSTTQWCLGTSSATIISYYSVACNSAAGYTYVHSLNKCLSYKSETRMSWGDAKEVCRQEGAHLVYVKTQATLDYIESHRESSITKYWFGGVQTEEGSNIFRWLSGETIDSTNGGQLWLAGRPNVDGRGNLCIEGKYSVDKTSFGLFDRACNSTRKFFCEIDN